MLGRIVVVLAALLLWMTYLYMSLRLEIRARSEWEVKMKADMASCKDRCCNKGYLTSHPKRIKRRRQCKAKKSLYSSHVHESEPSPPNPSLATETSVPSSNKSSLSSSSSSATSSKKNFPIATELKKLYDKSFSKVRSFIDGNMLTQIYRLIVNSRRSSLIEIDLEDDCYILATLIIYGIRAPSSIGLNEVQSKNFEMNMAVELLQQLLKYKFSLSRKGQDVVSTITTLCNALVTVGKVTEAHNAIGSGISKLQPSFELFEQRAELNMVTFESLLNSGVALRNVQRTEVASSIKNDLSEAIRLREKNQKSYDVENRKKVSNSYILLGYVAYKQNQIMEGCKKIEHALSLENGTALSWNMYGRCQRDYGDAFDAIESYRTAISIEESIQTRVDIALSYVEASLTDSALGEIEATIRMIRKELKKKSGDETYLNEQLHILYGYKGLIFQSTGHQEKSISPFRKASYYGKSNTQPFLLLGESYATLGKHKLAIDAFNQVLKIDSSHHIAFYRRELCYYYASRKYDPLMSYDTDDEVDNKLRYGISKGLSAQTVGYNGSFHEEYTGEVNNNVSISEYEKAKIYKLLEDVMRVSTLLQLDSPGFLENERQHRQFSIAVVHVAQKLNEVVERKMNGDPVEYTWRDMFKVISKYRQLADFKDIVFWIDKFPPVEKKENLYGLRTSMLEGPKKILRYYPYYEKSLELAKQLLLENGYYDDREILIPLKEKSTRKAIKESTNIEEVVQIIKMTNGLDSDALFPGVFVNVPIESVVANSRNSLNGTRLTMSTMNDKGGIEFSICHSSAPERFIMYEKELSYVFNRVIDSVLKLRSLQRECTLDMKNEVDITFNIQKIKENVLKEALEIFYYWVNFAPLTRGTSATGYASLTALILLINWEISSPLPRLVQLDWEAILSPSLNAFVEKVTAMLHINKNGSSIFDEYINSKEESKIENSIKTLEHLYFALRLSSDASNNNTETPTETRY